MDDYFIRWKCSYCTHIHTRKIEPSIVRNKPEIVHMETFEAPFPKIGAEYQDLKIHQDGHNVLITFVAPINLTCSLTMYLDKEVTVPYERRTVKRTDDF